MEVSVLVIISLFNNKLLFMQFSTLLLGFVLPKDCRLFELSMISKCAKFIFVYVQNWALRVFGLINKWEPILLLHH